MKLHIPMSRPIEFGRNLERTVGYFTQAVSSIYKTEISSRVFLHIVIFFLSCVKTKLILQNGLYIQMVVSAYAEYEEQDLISMGAHGLLSQVTAQMKKMQIFGSAERNSNRHFTSYLSSIRQCEIQNKLSLFKKTFCTL